MSRLLCHHFDFDDEPSKLSSLFLLLSAKSAKKPIRFPPRGEKEPELEQIKIDFDCFVSLTDHSRGCLLDKRRENMRRSRTRTSVG